MLQLWFLLEIRDRAGGGGAGESLSPTPIFRYFFHPRDYERSINKESYINYLSPPSQPSEKSFIVTFLSFLWSLLFRHKKLYNITFISVNLSLHDLFEEEKNCILIVKL